MSMPEANQNLLSLREDFGELEVLGLPLIEREGIVRRKSDQLHAAVVKPNIIVTSVDSQMKYLDLFN